MVERDDNESDQDPFDADSEERRYEIIDETVAASADKRKAQDVWLVSYSDFMTILMIFFLAMYGYTYLARTALSAQQQKMGAAAQFDQVLDRMQERLGDDMAVEESDRKTTVRFAEKILFTSGHADISREARRNLEELAESLKLIEGDVIVEGHTDSVPISSGRFRSNWELSAARAFSVIQALTAAGVPGEKLAAWGFGEHRPRGDNATPEGRSENRRIEIVILKKNAA